MLTLLSIECNVRLATREACPTVRNPLAPL